MKKTRSQRKQCGSAALEYIIVSTCAAVLALGAAGFVKDIFAERMQHLKEELQNTDDLNQPFDDHR